MRPLDYCAREKSKKWEATAEMHERRIFLEVERHFISAENSSSNQLFLGKNALKTPRKKLMRNKRGKCSAEASKIINPDDLEAGPLPRKRVRTER